ncbi:sigma-70 family RNA polymerase sigma factor [Rothia sp. ZJ1223]|uniref:sigma-70 family RNA polymerase sigma factor n=1 Tax=Rothia sp. ZJ1223 TaxID=2811098 RepID=UPI00195C3ED1|nr:sigma-70 family RNA polymerase sigma factor [Rothia sp. ZJ1223]MBM7051022.1 sigma-70 family RNA polymerase sigma factor [Rothia sp. ZJ1223]
MSQDNTGRQPITIRFEKDSFHPSRTYREQTFEISADEAEIIIENDYNHRLHTADNPDGVQRRAVAEIFKEEISKPEYNQAKKWVRNTTGNPTHEEESLIETEVDSHGYLAGHGNTDPVIESLFGSRIWDAIDALPERERLVLVAVKIQGYTQSEVARFLGVSQPMVNRILKRAIARLEAQLS